MREESHLEDMRAAIRGDFERLEERRGEQELMRPPAAPHEPEVSAKVDPEPEPEPEPEAAAEAELVPEPESADGEPADEAGETPRRSWLDRLLGR